MKASRRYLPSSCAFTEGKRMKKSVSMFAPRYESADSASEERSGKGMMSPVTMFLSPFAPRVYTDG